LLELNDTNTALVLFLETSVDGFGQIVRRTLSQFPWILVSTVANGVYDFEQGVSRKRHKPRGEVK
jgi:hypothetical protein